MNLLIMKQDKLAIYEQAADWVEQTNTLSAIQKAELERWLKQDPEHLKAYQKCLKVWQSENLQQVLVTQTNRARLANKPGHLKSKLIATACSVCLLVILGYINFEPVPEQNKITAYTHTSESRELHLPDGSELKLSGETKLEFEFMPEQRQVSLDTGESLFSVQHLAENQPFIVDAGDTEIRVTGTQFSVDKNHYSTQVIVVEGSVLVSNQSKQVHLTAGQSVEIIAGNIGKVIKLPEYFEHYLSGEQADSLWLDAYQSSLGSVVAKLDRQLEEDISLEDSRLQGLAVTGRFNLNTPKHTLKMLAMANQLRVAEYPGQIIIRRN